MVVFLYKVFNPLTASWCFYSRSTAVLTWKIQIQWNGLTVFPFFSDHRCVGFGGAKLLFNTCLGLKQMYVCTMFLIISIYVTFRDEPSLNYQNVKNELLLFLKSTHNSEHFEPRTVTVAFKLWKLWRFKVESFKTAILRKRNLKFRHFQHYSFLSNQCFIIVTLS
jgi:hypothetical protein